MRPFLVWSAVLVHAIAVVLLALIWLTVLRWPLWQVRVVAGLAGGGAPVVGYLLLAAIVNRPRWRPPA